MYPLTAFSLYVRYVLGWWVKRVGVWGVALMLIAGTILAVILNYTT